MEGSEETSSDCDRNCANCKTTVTPLWRKFGPVKFLCNACGLYFKVNGDHRPYYMSKNKLNSSAKKSLLRCANCGTNKTTMWRKNGGLHVCNACGLYFRINGHNRPVTMRKDIIRTRRRRDTAAFEMLDPLENCNTGPSADMLPDVIKHEDLAEYEKHPYKMMINVREHSFMLGNNQSESEHHLSHYSHHHHHHHQHTCHDGEHLRQTENTLPPSQLMNGQVDTNGYYCPFF